MPPTPTSIALIGGIRTERPGNLAKGPGQGAPLTLDPQGFARFTSGEVTSITSNGTAITAAGSTSVLGTPPAGSIYLIRYLQADNTGGDACIVSWHTTKDARKRYRTSLGIGQTWYRDFMTGFWLIIDSDLNINLSAISNIEWHVDYQIVSLNQ